MIFHMSIYSHNELARFDSMVSIVDDETGTFAIRPCL